MNSNAGNSQYEQLTEALRKRLREGSTCSQVIDDYEMVMRSTWDFLIRLFGEEGTKAIMGRSIDLASNDEPLLASVHISALGIDLSEFRNQVAKTGCSTPRVVRAVLRLGAATFQLLSKIAGEAATKPLLRRLEEEKPTQQ